MGKKRKLPERYQVGFLSKMDNRTDVAFRLNRAFSEMIDEAGGADNLTHAQLAFIEHFVFIEELIRETMQKYMESPGEADKLIARCVQAQNGLIGLSKRIPGAAKRINKPPVDVQTYVTGKGQR